jgi:hypothetical protein
VLWPNAWDTPRKTSTASRRRRSTPSPESATSSTWPPSAPGETVLDLGSGSGMDSFIAARAAGPDGHTIGVDMTDEQLAKATRLAREAGMTTPSSGRATRRFHHDETRHIGYGSSLRGAMLAWNSITETRARTGASTRPGTTAIRLWSTECDRAESLSTSSVEASTQWAVGARDAEGRRRGIARARHLVAATLPRFHDASTTSFGTCQSTAGDGRHSASEAASWECPRQDSNLRPAA